MKKELLSKVFMAMMMVFALSCSSSDDSNDEGVSNDISNQDAQYEQMLKGTSWKIDKDFYFNEGEGRENHTDGIMTFAYNNIWYLIGLYNYIDADGTWSVENGLLEIVVKNYTSDMGLAAFRGFVSTAGFLRNKIVYLTDSKMRLKWSSDETNKSSVEFVKVTYREGTIQGGHNGNSSGGSSSGDKPYVTSFDFTATKTSITVKFMCSERPSSATVKYGISSASGTVSSSISGKQVSATVNGLKSGTKYYFKCTVSNSYGSSTSDTFTAITNY